MGKADRRVERVLGKQVPLACDILGLHLRFDPESPTQDLLRLLWSLRHIALLFMVLMLFMRFGRSPVTATTGAPLLFWPGVVVVGMAWVQGSRLSANLAAQRSPGFLSRAVAMALLVVTEFRSSLPMLRTFFLALCLVFAGLRLAEAAGSYESILPLSWLRMPSKPAVEPTKIETLTEEERARLTKEAQEAKEREEAATRAAVPATQPKVEEEQPLPPPEDDEE
ncbi:MAG: hypothetical protein FWD53_06000 [Phycisphaerales bacterium]|nr:hypothetical protein [Phycisphaerales bacterium]